MNITKVDWQRFSIEAAVIVASILLAFSIEAWWDEAQRSSDEIELLLDFQTDISNSIDRLDEHDLILEGAISDTQAFLKLSAEDIAQLDQSYFWRSIVNPIQRSFIVRTISHGVINATINSGNLSLLQSSELQAAIVGIEDFENTLEVVGDDVRELTDTAFFELSYYEDTQSRYLNDSGEDEISRETIVELTRNRRIRAAMTAKMQRWQVYRNNQNLLIEHLENILQLIETELAKQNVASET